MSNYVAPAFHPKTGLIDDATWLDNHFGAHIYGVKFHDDDKIYKSVECGMEAAAVEIERLRDGLKEIYNNGIELCGAGCVAVATAVLDQQQAAQEKP